MVSQRKLSYFVLVQVIILYFLQNMASYLVIPNYNLIKQDWGVSDSLLGLMSGGYFFLNGFGAIFWSFFSDASLLKRKIFLTSSMIAAGICILMSYYSQSFFSLLIWQVLTGAAFGSVIPLCFSILSDAFESSRRTSIFMLWYFLGGFGLVAGFGFSVIMGSYFNWKTPLFYGAIIIMVIGGLTSISLLEPPRAASEKEIQDLIENGISYHYTIKLTDFPAILQNRSNIYVVAQGVLGTIPSGIIFAWTVQYLIRDAGASEIAAALLFGLMSLGAIGSIRVSWIVDKLYTRDPIYRPVVAGVSSIFEAILFIMFFLLPLKLDIYTKNIAVAVQLIISKMFSDAVLLIAYVFFFVAMLFSSAVGPIRNSILSDVNLPEHRATALSVIMILELFSKGIGITLIGALSDILGTLRISIIIAMSFWLLSGFVWLYLTKYYPYDLQFVRGILEKYRLDLISSKKEK